jgi:hypothetical protein
MSDINCPYCDAELEINHDDGYGYEEDQLHQQQCSACDKYFTYTTSILYVYEAEEASCLNDGEHDYKPTITYPKEYTRMKCRTCEEERSLTGEERKTYNIPDDK